MAVPGPLHLRPTAELAERALLPGDPGRALLLAQALLQEPRMFNHHRGLWGYTGTASDGGALTVQSTGMGGPSAAIVLEELADLGLRRAIRVGSCGALDERLALAELVVAERALADDGASRALAAADTLAADPELTVALREAAAPSVSGLVASTDLFYDPRPRTAERWRKAGAAAVEMEAAALFAVGHRRGVAVACVLVVSDLLFAQPGRPGRGRRRISDKGLAGASEGAARHAARALAVPAIAG
ncbi:MAG: purine-nucleoside phosphorylase [Actinobacteria bacterium]|nr:MAG: purine-nucleoside phosphorylase [Actinomycetota bacterium]